MKMKYFLLIIISITLLLSFQVPIHAQNGDKTLKLELETGQSTFSPAVLMSYMESIEHRLHYFGFDPVQVKVYDRKDKIYVNVTNVEDPVLTSDLITGTGDFKILPIYKFDDGGQMDALFNLLEKEIAVGGKLEGLFEINTTTMPGYNFRRFPPAVIGMTPGKHLEKVNTFLASPAVQSTLPENGVFIWAQKASKLHEGKYDLYLANTTPGQGLEGDHVSRTNVYQEENRFSRVRDIIDLWLDKDGTSQLDKITRANVKRELIIVLNNAVISAPIVEGPIETGNLQIEGPFSGQETTALSKILRMKSLPGPPVVVSTVVE